MNQKIEKEVPEWQKRKVGVMTASGYKQLTLEESVTDTRDNWDRLDYGVMKGWYDMDPNAVKAMMKKIGYYPVGSYGGVVNFQHYSRKAPKAPE